MPWFHQTLKVADLMTSELKRNTIGSIIEAEGQVHMCVTICLMTVHCALP
jgi:hypothetical protein